MKLVVIDGQSGRTGALLVERVRTVGLPLELLAVGTNAIATAAMMKAGAQRGATGENPVLLLDDIMSELDKKRRAFILNHINDTQIIVTCTDTDGFDIPGDARLFEVKNGTALQL